MAYPKVIDSSLYFESITVFFIAFYTDSFSSCSFKFIFKYWYEIQKYNIIFK